MPGWDCHGLPIEWKIEEQLRGQGPSQGRGLQGRVPREACREYAGKLHRPAEATSFKRLGITGRLREPLCHDGLCVRGGHRYRVPQVQELWPADIVAPSRSCGRPVERTALADAEIEYHDHVSPDDLGQVPGASPRPTTMTTTFWPSATRRPRSSSGPPRPGPSRPTGRSPMADEHRATAVYEVQAMETGLEFEPWAKAGDRLIVADKLAEDVFKAAKIASLDAVSTPGQSVGAWSAPTLWLRSIPAITASLCPCCPGITSPTTPVRALSTPRRATAPTTTRSGRRTATSESARHRRSRRRLLSTTWPCSPASRCWRPRARRPASSAPPTRAVMEKLIAAGNAAGARPDGAFLSALVALQGADHLPQHPPVVHSHGSSRSRPRCMAGGPCAETALKAIEAIPTSTPRPGATASAPWSRAVPTGWSAASAHGARLWPCIVDKQTEPAAASTMTVDARIVELIIGRAWRRHLVHPRRTADFLGEP